jgi:formate dehydrogenase subunit beta
MDEFLKNIKDNKDHENLREACRACERPIPENTDITIGIYGTDFKKPLFYAQTETGKEVLSKAGVKAQEESEERKKAVDALLKRRIDAWKTLSENTKTQVAGIENLISFFDSCINCHNCMDVCPVCYCRECFFESPTFEYESDRYLSWAQRKGAIKMPRDTILFHLTRLNHMSTSCVGCGMCEQACPSRIELMRFYKTVGYKAQKVFDYVAGRSIDEALPLLTFREDELDPR